MIETILLKKIRFKNDWKFAKKATEKYSAETWE
jgi:hypothetical protein